MKIVVLAGGLSPERDVSLSTGTVVTNALIAGGHRAILVDMLCGLPGLSAAPAALFADADTLPPHPVAAAEPDLAALKKRYPVDDNGFGPNVMTLCLAADCVFMALHGDSGENGTVQALFDRHKIRYTGSGAESCRLAMDKWLSKQVFFREAIETPKGILLKKDVPVDPALIPLPCCVKPCCGGSSIGITLVRDRAALEGALKLAFSMEDTVLVEELITGRELSCGVLGGKALPLIEIIPKEGFYDYFNKYQAGATTEITPAPLPPVITRHIQQESERVFAALGLSVYARIDYLLTADGHAYALEANTLPGMTPTSLLPQEAQAVGIDFTTLVNTIVRLSLELRP